MTEHMSVAEYRALMRAEATGAKTRSHKFNARTITGEDGKRFDSAFEAERWARLKLLERTGEIRKLRRQVRIVLHDGKGAPYLVRSPRYHHGRKLTYVADCMYEERGGASEWTAVIEDDKGFDTPVSRAKRAIVERMLGCTVRIVRKQRPARRARRGRTRASARR